MLRYMKRFVVMAVVVGVLAGWNASALGWNRNEYPVNLTGQDAHDLTKVIPGYWVITEVMTGYPFNDYAVLHWGGFTFIHWYNGVVPPLGTASACFTVKGNKGARMAVSWWTNASGNIIGLAGVEFWVHRNMVGDDVEVVLEHTWRDWNGTAYPPEPGDGPGDAMGPITMTEIYYALSDTLYTLEDLDEDLWIDPELTWTQLNTAGDVVLDYGEDVAYNIGAHADDQVVLVWVRAEGGGLDNTLTIDQFEVYDPVPTVSEWGLVAMALLVLAAGTVLVRRRRAMAA